MLILLRLTMLLVVLFSCRSFAVEPPSYPATSMPEHWQLTLVDETVFGSKVFVAEIGDPQLPTVLLIHGMGQIGLKDWLKVIPALEQHYHVVALDLPGYGRSDKPPGKYSPSNYAAVVHQVKQQFSAAPVHVVGHSMGGAVSLRYADLYPEDVSTVVLVAAAGILERSAFVKHSLTGLINNQQLPELLEGAQDLVDQYAGNVMDWLNRLPDPTSALGNYQLLWGGLLVNRSNANAGLALVEEDFSRAIFNSETAFEIIWGRNDRVAPLRTGKLLAGQLRHARLSIIEDAEHLPMHSNTAEFNALLLAALSRSSAPEITTATAADDIKQAPELSCKDQRNKVYSGSYSRISINNCRGIVLQDIRASSLEINASQLEIENLTLKTDQLAMIVDQSLVVGTNIVIEAKTAMRVANSRIDFAGSLISSSDSAVLVDAPSTLVFSVSQLDSASYKGYLHGNYRIQHGALAEWLAANH
jgi:pimeloyl-ACP methyl ester carboxylesterase